MVWLVRSWIHPWGVLRPVQNCLWLAHSGWKIKTQNGACEQVATEIDQSFKVYWCCVYVWWSKTHCGWKAPWFSLRAAGINQAWAARSTSSQENSMLFALATSFWRNLHQGEKLVQRTVLDSWLVFAKSGKLSPALLCNFMMLSELKLHTSLTQKPNVDARFSTSYISYYTL